MRARQLSHFLRLLLPFALVLVTVAAIISLTHARAEEPAATYTHGRLAITIPYRSQHEGPGKLVAEILDPEDHVLGRVERNVTIGKDDGSWQEVITPDKAHRVRRHHLAAPALPLRICRQQPPCDRRHRIHLADPSPARRPHPRPDRIPRRQRSRHPRHRLRRQQQRHPRDRHPPHRASHPQSKSRARSSPAASTAAAPSRPSSASPPA